VEELSPLASVSRSFDSGRTPYPGSRDFPDPRRSLQRLTATCVTPLFSDEPLRVLGYLRLAVVACPPSFFFVAGWAGMIPVVIFSSNVRGNEVSLFFHFKFGKSSRCGEFPTTRSMFSRASGRPIAFPPP